MSALEKFAIGDEEEAPRLIKKPYGIAARDGVVYVCDTKALNIARLDFKNKTFSVRVFYRFVENSEKIVCTIREEEWYFFH